MNDTMKWIAICCDADRRKKYWEQRALADIFTLEDAVQYYAKHLARSS